MTRRVDTEGMGASGDIHSANLSVHADQLFPRADEPEELVFVLDDEPANALIQAVEDSDIHVLCVRRAIDYWSFGKRQ